MSTRKTVTAADLRAYYNGNEKRLARLSPEARKTVEPGARGQVHPEAIKDHNRFRKVQYVRGASGTLNTETRKAAAALRAQAVAAGFEVGERGPLPKAFLATV